MRTARRLRWALLLLAVVIVSLVVQLFVPAVCSLWHHPRPGTQTAQEMMIRWADGPHAVQHVQYLLYLPRDYGTREQGWPMLLFLHGSRQRGDDLALVKQVGIPRQIQAGKQFPFIVVSPQCRKERSWEPRHLLALLDHIEAGYAVDQDRVYVTGFELGGYGAWNLAAEAPERFAAVAPICGVPQKEQHREGPDRLKGLACWAYHGTRDQTTWFPMVEELFDRLWSAGAPARLTVFAETRDRQVWSAPYDSPSFIAWLASKRRRNALRSGWLNGCPSPGKQVAAEFRTGAADVGGNGCVGMRYSIYLPTDYGNTDCAWPLLLFLHDSQQRRDDPGPAVKAGPPGLIDEGVDFPCVVLSPESASGASWELKKLFLLLDHIQNEFRVDPNRICVSGIGLGGEATWNLAVSEPDRFAAIVPIDAIPGQGFRAESHYLKRMAIWAFRCDVEAAARFSYIKDMIEKFKQGGSAKLTRYLANESKPYARIYNDPALRAWLGAQRRNLKQPDVGEWIGHAREAFPPPRDVVRLFLSLEYRFTGGRYHDAPFHYRLFVPEPMEPGRKYPLIIWLHGHGWEELELEAGHLKYTELIFTDPQNRAHYPFFVLAPLCPRDRYWFDQHHAVGDEVSPVASDEPCEVVMRMVDTLIRDYPINPDRITAFGISSGAGACWELASAIQIVWQQLHRPAHSVVTREAPIA